MNHARSFPWRSSTALIGAGLLSAALLSPGGPGVVRAPAMHKAASASGAGFINVYTNNIENLMNPHTGTDTNNCFGIWQDLVKDMVIERYKPDIFLVQQVTANQALKLAQEMTADLGTQYVATVPRDAQTAQSSPCPGKTLQANAVIWRANRFTFQRSIAFQTYKESGTSCVMNNQDRTWVAQVMLKDTVASKLVDVESVHLDTSVTNTCAKQNWTDLLQKNMTLNGFSGALHIIGGDFNIYDVADPNNLSAGMKSWWNTATINYKDAINDFCATTTNRLDCDANQNWTSKAGHHRIDFIFAQRSDGTKPTMPYRFTIPFTENASSYTYSDHQAITALINY